MAVNNVTNRRRYQRAAGDPLGIISAPPFEPSPPRSNAPTNPSDNIFTSGSNISASVPGIDPRKEAENIFKKGANSSFIRNGGPPEESPERQARRRRRRMG